MARAKKDYITLSIKADAAVWRRLDKYCEEVGQTKTLALERMITECIDRYEEEKKLVESIRKGQKAL